MATWYLNEGTVVSRLPRSAHPSLAPTQMFRSADGWVMIMCMKDKFWNALIDCLGRPDLALDERFSSMQRRRDHLRELTEVLDAEFVQAPTAHWLDALAGKLPVAPVNDIAEALDNPFLQQTGMIEQLAHPDRDDFRLLANPIKVAGQRLAGRPCGRLGADTAAVLHRFGFDDARIAELAAQGAVHIASEDRENKPCKNE